MSAATGAHGQNAPIGPETFTMVAARFDVTRAKAMIASAPDDHRVEEIPTEHLLPLLNWLGVWPDQAAALPDGALNEPLIAATLESGKPQIIDGLHRIHAAGIRGRASLAVVHLSREESVAIQFGQVVL